MSASAKTQDVYYLLCNWQIALGGEQRMLPDEGIKSVLILPLSLCGGATLQ